MPGATVALIRSQPVSPAGGAHRGKGQAIDYSSLLK